MNVCSTSYRSPPHGLNQNIPPNSPLCRLGVGTESARSVDRLLSCFITYTRIALVASVYTTPTLHVRRRGTHLLKLVFSFLKIQMTPYARILSRELDNLFPIQVVYQSRVDFARELVNV